MVFICLTQYSEIFVKKNNLTIIYDENRIKTCIYDKCRIYLFYDSCRIKKSPVNKVFKK